MLGIGIGITVQYVDLHIILGNASQHHITNPLKHPIWYHKSAQLEEVGEHTALLLKPAPGRPSGLASRKE